MGGSVLATVEVFVVAAEAVAAAVAGVVPDVATLDMEDLRCCSCVGGVAVAVFVAAAAAAFALDDAEDDARFDLVLLVEAAVDAPYDPREADPPRPLLFEVVVVDVDACCCCRAARCAAISFRTADTERAEDADGGWDDDGCCCCCCC